MKWVLMAAVVVAACQTVEDGRHGEGGAGRPGGPLRDG